MPTPKSPTEDTLYDLAIIGGGITGAAVARDAALRGLKTILFEKTDFGAGANCHACWGAARERQHKKHA